MGVSRRLGDIQIFAELSRGPSTIVSKGYQPALDRFVLLKVLRPQVTGNESIIVRLEEEARLIARIQHENVVSIYDFGSDENTAYIATEYVDGFDLHTLISRKALPVEVAVFILLEISKGLRAAHAERVLHRDLKPSNVMISYSGEVKLTDFGFASLIGEETGEIRGTPSYLAPEQVRGEPLSPSCDLFSIGVIFFEMLAGHLAFPGKSTGDILDSILNDTPGEKLYLMDSIHSDVAALCNRLLSKNPDDRFSSTDKLIEELSALNTSSFTAEALEQYISAPHEYRAKLTSVSNVEGKTGDRAGGKDAEDGTDSHISVGPVQKRTRRRLTTVILSIAVTGAFLITGILALTRGDSGDPQQRRDQPIATPPGSQNPTGNDLSSAQIPIETDKNPAGGSATDDASAAVRADAGNAIVAAEPANVLHPADLGVSPGTDTLLSLSADATNDATPDLRPGQLLVDSAPWATLFIDGDSVATTPLRAPVNVTAGEHTMVLRHPEFPDYETRIEIESGKALDLNVSLFALVGQIYLDISPWAEVSIDDAVRDTIPPQEHPLLLAAGEYSLRLRHPSLGVWETSILVEAGQTQHLRFNLNELLSQ